MLCCVSSVQQNRLLHSVWMCERLSKLQTASLYHGTATTYIYVVAASNIVLCFLKLRSQPINTFFQQQQQPATNKKTPNTGCSVIVFDFFSLLGLLPSRQNSLKWAEFVRACLNILFYFVAFVLSWVFFAHHRHHLRYKSTTSYLSN